MSLSGWQTNVVLRHRDDLSRTDVCMNALCVEWHFSTVTTNVAFSIGKEWECNCILQYRQEHHTRTHTRMHAHTHTHTHSLFGKVQIGRTQISALQLKLGQGMAFLGHVAIAKGTSVSGIAGSESSLALLRHKILGFCFCFCSNLLTKALRSSSVSSMSVLMSQVISGVWKQQQKYHHRKYNACRPNRNCNVLYTAHECIEMYTDVVHCIKRDITQGQS